MLKELVMIKKYFKIFISMTPLYVCGTCNDVEKAATALATKLSPREALSLNSSLPKITR